MPNLHNDRVRAAAAIAASVVAPRSAPWSQKQGVLERDIYPFSAALCQCAHDIGQSVSREATWRAPLKKCLRQIDCIGAASDRGGAVVPRVYVKLRAS
jgi:hypothetical protein